MKRFQVDFNAPFTSQSPFIKERPVHPSLSGEYCARFCILVRNALLKNDVSALAKLLTAGYGLRYRAPDVVLKATLELIRRQKDPRFHLDCIRIFRRLVVDCPTDWVGAVVCRTSQLFLSS